MKAIHILRRINGFNHFVFRNMVRNWDECFSIVFANDGVGFGGPVPGLSGHVRNKDLGKI